MKIAVTYAPHLAPWFSDVAFATSMALAELGHSVELTPCKSLSGFNASDRDIIFVIAPHGYQENQQSFVKNPNKRYVCWDLEQTPFRDQINVITSKRFERTLEYFTNYDFFFTEAETKAEYFRQQGYPAHCLNFGYHSHYTKQVLAGDKEYDIFFVGIMFPRRATILQQLMAAGLTLYPATGNFFDPVQKAIAIKSSKICLNIHHNDMPYFEKPRIIQDIMANEGLCLTETIAYPEGFKHGEHLIMADYGALVETAIEWSKKTDERKEIARNGLKFLATEYRAAKFLDEMLRIING